MKTIFRKVQFLSNIATIIIAVLLCVITVKLFYLASPIRIGNPPRPEPSSSVPNSTETIPIGKIIPLENINWKANKRTLVLYLSTTCRYCTESGPFYKRVVEEFSNHQDLKLVAIFPQSVEESRDYLKRLGVNINDVHDAALTSIGVRGTPTLLLVDDSGVVSEIWRGKLTSEREKEVLDKLSS